MPMRDPDEREILDLIPERFDSDLDSSKSRRSTLTRVAISCALGLLAIAALGVTARHIFFGDGESGVTQSQIPVVAPDSAPIKNRPEDQGGMAVPNQDKLVFNEFSGGKSSSATPSEQLLPPPEQPKSPPVASIKPAFPPASSASNAGPSSAPPAPTPAPAVPAVTAQAMPKPAMPTPVLPTPATKPVSAAAPAAAPKAAASGGGWLVQLGALRSEADAKTEWAHIQAADKDLVSGISSDIQKADLGARGIYWRLRAGPLDEAAARTLCTQFIKHGRGCLVVRK